MLCFTEPSALRKAWAKTKINVEIKLVGKFPFKWKCRDVYLEAQL